MAALGMAGMAIQPREVRTLELPLRGLDWGRDIRLRVGAVHYRLRF
jgi:hypothetical protein